MEELEQANQNLDKNLLQEDLTSAADPSVATTDQDLSIGQMFQQSSLPSLGKQIFSVIPMYGPTAGLFNLKRSATPDSNGNTVFKLVRRDASVYNSTSIPTGLTQEAAQDIWAMFGKSTPLVIGSLLRGIANDDENAKTLAFLDAQSAASTGITLSSSGNAETNLFEITQKVHELVLQINSLSLRSYQAYAVIPYTPLAGIMGLSSYAGANNITERGLFIAEFGQTKFYMNPNPASTTAYVGIKDFNPSKSSAVFSPYTSDVIEAVDPDSGELFYHLYNRYAITASPLHETGKEMMYKFTIA